jgi:hypothetical protein
MIYRGPWKEEIRRIYTAPKYRYIKEKGSMK